MELWVICENGNRLLNAKGVYRNGSTLYFITGIGGTQPPQVRYSDSEEAEGVFECITRKLQSAIDAGKRAVIVEV